MPPEAGRPMAEQDFRARPTPRRSRPVRLADRLWRLGAFVPAFALTTSLIAGITDWFGSGGVTALEGTVIVLVALTFIWVSLSVTTVGLGLIRRLLTRGRVVPRAPLAGPPQDVALLIPIYNETPAAVFGNARAMLQDLADDPLPHRYSLYILSDTQDPLIALQEERGFANLHATCPPGLAVNYRRRSENTDRKVGNLNDWITHWGGAHDAMVVLDADSLMSGQAISHLVAEMAADEDAGLIQSFPRLIGAETLFGRMQQFSNAVYGWLLAEGLAVWSLREGNYWGHNAIIRTSAFAESARLPYLKGRGGREDLILSHDFIEAGMLRRAGWSVRFLPQDAGSYEEAPQTLVDYALRDRRWCQGNLQHLRLLTARGFHPVSRLHLLQGAFAFLMSPLWLALIVIWSLVGAMEPATAPYFTAANPLFPVWPEVAAISGWTYLAFIYGMLLFPKIVGTIALSMQRETRKSYGGRWRLFGSALFEILCSIIYAPVLMMQQAIAVSLAFLGKSKSWAPQSRGTTGYSWAALVRFHAIETVFGIALASFIVTGLASLWLAPIAISLALSVPLSRASAWRVNDLKAAALRLDAPQDLNVPNIVSLAQVERARMAAHLSEPQSAIAAE